MTGRAVRRLDDALVERLAQHWLRGWNDADLDTIMAPMAPDVVFSSPGIAMLTGDVTRSRIEGADALRSYLERALRLSAGVRYSLEATRVGTDSITLIYECGLPDGPRKSGADLMRVDERGEIVEWRCHF